MDSSTCSAVGMVPDALLETVEAAMAWRRAGHNCRSQQSVSSGVTVCKYRIGKTERNRVNSTVRTRQVPGANYMTSPLTPVSSEA